MRWNEWFIVLFVSAVCVGMVVKVKGPIKETEVAAPTLIHFTTDEGLECVTRARGLSCNWDKFNREQGDEVNL